MDIVETVKLAATKFYKELNEDPNGSSRSWEHCYSVFYKARQKQISDDDIDFLSLHLAFYLASWGMYRGSSFLLQKDYQTHKPVVREILLKKYDPLFGIKCSEFKDLKNRELLKDIEIYLKDFFNPIRASVKKKTIHNDISEILITKILIGTLGCVPAYDRYFVESIRKHKITSGTYSVESIRKLAAFYEENEKEFEAIRVNMKVGDMPYPQMKVLDMGFWNMAFDAEKIV